MASRLSNLRESAKQWLVRLPSEPKVVYSDRDVIVAFKPSGIHTVNIANRESPTLANWLHRFQSQVMEVQGRSKGDGGILHRLDGATAGLVVAARNQEAFNRMIEAGPFDKEYIAITSIPSSPVELREWPFSVDSSGMRWHQRLSQTTIGKYRENGFEFCIASRFEPYGPKGSRVKVVNVVEDKRKAQGDLPSDFYYTDCKLVAKLDEETVAFKVSLNRGFRHQVRAHLNYLGCPIINDPLYPVTPGQLELPSPEELLGDMGLYAASVTFVHPTKQNRIKVVLPQFEEYL